MIHFFPARDLTWSSSLWRSFGRFLFFICSSGSPILNSSKCRTMFVTLAAFFDWSRSFCLTWKDERTWLNLFFQNPPPSRLFVSLVKLLVELFASSRFKFLAAFDDTSPKMPFFGSTLPVESCCLFSSIRNDGLGIFFKINVLLRNCGFGGNAGGVLGGVGDDIVTSGNDSMSS